MDNLNLLRAEIFDRQKILARICAQAGQKTLADYVASWQMSDSALLTPVLPIIADLSKRLYGDEVAEGLIAQLSRASLVSTIDHHGIFGHPFFLNANLLFSLRVNLKYLPVFSTSGVSLNNSSWPGCVSFTNPHNGELVRQSFFHDGHKTKTVFALPSIDKSGVQKFIERIHRQEALSLANRQRFVGLVEEIFSTPDIFTQKNFSDQAGKLSRRLWQVVFPQAPELIYLPVEDIAGEIISQIIAPDAGHILHQLLLTDGGAKVMERYFTGLRGAFGNGRGSYLFWAVNPSGQRVALSRRDHFITSLSGDVKYRLEPAVISQALKARQIYPSSLTCFLIMLYYGFNCLGGFNQTSWLTVIQEKFSQLLGEVGESESAGQVLRVVTDNFAETPLAFAKVGQVLTKPALLDLYLRNCDYQNLARMADKISLGQSLETEMPEIYKIAVPANQRRPELSIITSGQIATANGLTRLLGLL